MVVGKKMWGKKIRAAKKVDSLTLTAYGSHYSSRD